MSIDHAYVMPHPPIIIPEVGRGEQSKIEKTVLAFNKAAEEIAAIAPETIIVVSPHAPMYADYFHISPGQSAYGDFSAFRAPQVALRGSYDREFADIVADMASSENFPAGTLGSDDDRLDHGTLIPLYFINQKYRDYRLVRSGISGLPLLSHYQYGELLQRAAKKLGRRTVLIASGDLSHRLKKEGPYGYKKEGPEFDAQVQDIILSGNFEKLMEFSPDFLESAAECGLRSFVVMAGALDKRKAEAKSFSYQDTFGVGYAVMSVSAGAADSSRDFGNIYAQNQRAQAELLHKNEDDYVSLARASLEYYLKYGRYMDVPCPLPAGMEKRAGVFVSLKKDGQLRGCIGTINATQNNIAAEIVHNAVSAGTQDPRFASVKEDELPYIVYSVDELGEAEPAKKKDLNPKKYGVIVTNGVRRGLLLPNLDGVDTVKEQLSIALQKAGIAPDENYSIERFLVVRHK